MVCFPGHKGVSELLYWARLPSSQNNLLRVLLEHERGTGQCWMSVGRLMMGTGLRSKQSIFTHLGELEARGLITRQAPGGTNQRRCNSYHLHWEALVAIVLAPSPRKKSQRKKHTANQPRATPCTSSRKVLLAGQPSALHTEPPSDTAPLHDAVPARTALALGVVLPGETAPTEATPGGGETPGDEETFEDMLPAEVTIFEDILGLLEGADEATLSGEDPSRTVAEDLPGGGCKDLPGDGYEDLSGDGGEDLPEEDNEDLLEHGEDLPEDGEDLLEHGSEKPGKDLLGEEVWLAGADLGPLPTPQAEAPDEVTSVPSLGGLPSDAKSPQKEQLRRVGALVRPGAAQARPALQLVEETPSTPSSRAGTSLAITPRLLWELWREAYEAAYLRPYLACPQDERVLPGLVDACQAAVGHRHTICPHEDPTSLARRYLQHVFAAFLRRSGRDEFLSKRGHPLALILGDLNALGVPWGHPPRQPLREEPKQETPLPLAEASSACRKLLSSLDEVRGKSIPRPRIVKRLG